MKHLLIGDPHVQVSNLEESKILFDWIKNIAETEQVDQITILGDLFHNHDVIRAQVMTFWLDTLNKLNNTPIVIIVGNHDMPGSKELEGRVSALDAFKDMANVTVMSSPTNKGVGYIPYMHNKEEFISEINKLQAKVVFCHETFDGAQYENGFYAPNGVSIDLMPKDTLIVSGHIHAQMEIKSDKATVWYPGTPRWLTASDANSTKGVWTFDDQIFEKKFFNVEEIIDPMLRFQINEGDTLPDLNKVNHQRTFVELTGTASWIKSQKKKIPDTIRVSSTITDRQTAKSIKNRKKTDINSFVLNNYTPTLVEKQELIDYLGTL